MSSEKWQQIDDLFDRVLDAEDPTLIDQETDPAVAEAVRKLWEHHVGAAASGFLEQPITIVQNLIDRVSATSQDLEALRVFDDGAVLGGRFLIKGLLGEGGMGQVYLAFNQKLGKLVALKTIRPSLAEDPVIRGRFVGEIKSAQAVTHPNVCRIYDLFEDGQTPFCSMEYLPGPTLDEFTLEPGSAGARAIALQLAEGLHAAHSNGIVHRDFKPQNVILIPPAEVGGFPRAVITDFGLARPLVETDVDGAARHSLRGAGTRDYMAPELLRGEAASIRSDIFAYGKVLERLLPSSKWVGRCVSPEVSARPASLVELIADLRGDAKVSRRAMLMGAAFGSVGMASAGYAVYRSKGAPRFPLMPTRQRLILNGLQSNAALGERALTLRQLLITGLRQSPMLGVIPDERLLAVLRRLKLPVSLPVALADLFAVAKLEKAAVVVDGTVEKAARGLRMLLRVFEPGVSVPAFELDRSVEDERQLVRLAQDAAMELRTEFAESGQSLRASSVPLEQVTSASPEAVDLYFRAVREYERADAAVALAFIDRALAIDGEFVLAHHYKAQVLMGMSRLQSALQSATEAFLRRERVSAREKTTIEYLAHYLSGDYRQALAACRTNSALFPEEPLFHRQVATAYCRLGNFEEAIPYSKLTLDLAPDSPSNHNELIGNLAEGMHPTEAIQVYEISRQGGMSSALLHQGAALARMVQGDYGKASDQISKFRAVSTFDRWGRVVQSACDVLQGKFVVAITNIESDLVYDTEVREERHKNLRLTYAAWLSEILGQPHRAMGHIEKLVQLEPFATSVYGLREAATVCSRNAGSHVLVGEAISKLQAIGRRWPSTHTRGILAQVLACQEEGPKAETLFREAMALWPDPVTIFCFGSWLSWHGKVEESARVLTEMERLRGKTIRHYFSGLLGLAAILQGKNFAKMSRFGDALREFNRVLKDWDAHARDCSLLADVRTERDRASLEARSR